jgi:O-antigen/teichoic acid export membrane protein
VNSTFRQILRHASVFGIGAILFRLASIVLLPLYTRYLTPSDYGVLAILDLTINLLSIVVGGGIASAATRSHFTVEGIAHYARVWWTAIIAVVTVASVVLACAFVMRAEISEIAFGRTLVTGASYLAVALPTLWLGSVTYVLESYFRSLKASTFLVSIGLVRLLINIALNILFVVGLGMGLAGVLWGNLLSAAVAGVVEFIVLSRALGRPIFDVTLLAPYWKFGWPLVVYGLLASVMHEADRYFLRLFVDLNGVGLYSVAYQIGQGVNTLVILPFTTIWGVLIYEVAKDPDAKETYARVFKHFVYGLSLVLLLAALFAAPILRIIAPPSYAPAAEIVPIVCLAYLLFSLHEHFKVPALLANRTASFLPVAAMAAAANVVLNLLLIPGFGAMGAAWASVLTFAVFSFAGLVQYRRIATYPYPFTRCGVVVLGMAVTYVLYRLFVRDVLGTSLQIIAAAAAWTAWAVLLFGRPLREHLAQTRSVAELFSEAGTGGSPR